VLNDAALKRTFLPTAAKSDNPEVALKAFSERNQENALKTRPKVCIFAAPSDTHNA